MNLLDTTMAMLRARPRNLSLPMIAKGAGIPFEWLAKLSKGRIAEPGVRKVQALHDYLAAQPTEAQTDA